jgi:hypothetical protein
VTVLIKEGRLGQDGKAQALLMPNAVEKEHLRGVMSSKEFSGVGGGAAGAEIGEPPSQAVSKLNAIGSVVADASLGDDLRLAALPHQGWKGYIGIAADLVYFIVWIE